MAKVYLTSEGAGRLRKELDNLVNTIRPVAAADLAQAREKGDLSENAEYHAAKERLADLDRQIGELQRKFSDIQLIDPDELNTDEVRILSRVKILNTKNNMELEYTLVDPVQADPRKNMISIKSPIAQGLLGKKVGAEASIQIPSGEVVFKVLSIELSQDL